MTKYQFFCIPNSERKQYTFLNMASESFLEEKKGILQQGFEVEGDVIYAESPESAVEKYKSHFIDAIDEYGNAEPSYAFAASVQAMHEKWLGSKGNNSKRLNKNKHEIFCKW